MTARSPGQGLEVRVAGRLVGVLSRLEGGGTRFTPDARWLGAGQHPPLGLAFLGDPKPRREVAAAPAWFENLLPERGSRLRGWISRQRRLQEGDSLSLLAALGKDLPGAVEILGESPGAGFEETLPEQGGPLLRFSLAGVQLKLSMLLSGDRFVFPVRGETGDWIVKVPGERFPELPEVEAATMSWARAAGLRTPDFHVLPIENVHGVEPELLGAPPKAFAIRRFDRGEAGRVHQEDFAQALDFRPEQKYGDGNPGTSYDRVARLVQDVCLEAELQEFTRRLAFVVASGNDDAHLKNWSFQWGHAHRPWLSPCYDLVASISWPDFGWRREGGPTLALRLGREEKFARLTRPCLERFAQRARFRDGVELFMEGLERARLAWPAAAERAPARMREAVEEHWRRVPLLREAGPLPG